MKSSALLVVAAIAGVAVAACGSDTSSDGGSGGASGKRLNVVAAENVWGSIVSQLGGAHVNVTSIVTDPNADPHDYQSSASTARAFATADYVVVNGAGYDGWADSLLNANPSSDRRVFDVADMLGRKGGDNPHFWYSPTDVAQVVDRVTSDLQSLDRADGADFAQRHATFETALSPYFERIAAIRAQFSGKKIASTESIFVPMADALGLDLISPPAFMKAISEGNDPPASTVSTFQSQLVSKQVSVLVFNKQTATAVTSNLEHIAAQNGIPVVGVTETIQPKDTPFQTWMVTELDALQKALSASP